MTLEKAISVLTEKYEEAQKNPQITNPLTYALYKTWRMADSKRRKK